MNKATRLTFALMIAAGVASGAAAQSSEATPEATPEMMPEATPEMMSEATPEMMPDTSMARPFLGVRLDLNEAGAIIISEVLADSAAEAAGLQVDDVIVGVNGTEIALIEDMIALISSLGVGDTVTLEIERAGDPMTIEATLGAMPEGM
ncbi:MAG: PDZ domain-containing protein, partial [Chloroflexota bacterium]|nr:PDZ domain-containing protein [Chloroflexota bacterium]